jgi:hypothetical protein
MGELGVGRGQIELLAALFHADAPNDVTPSAYNDDDPASRLPVSEIRSHVQAFHRGVRQCDGLCRCSSLLDSLWQA